MLNGFSVGFLGDVVCAYDYDSGQLYKYKSTGEIIEQEEIPAVDEKVFNFKAESIQGWNGDVDGYQYYEFGRNVSAGPEMGDVYVFPASIGGEKIKNIADFYHAQVKGRRFADNRDAGHTTRCGDN